MKKHILVLTAILNISSFAQGIWIDTTFGNSGFVFGNFSPIDGGTSPTSIAVQNDGKLVIGGTFGEAPNDHSFFISRFNVDGSIDSGFGWDGVSKYNISEYDVCNKVLIQPDGKMLLSGYSSVSGISNRDFAVFRFDSNGTLDNSFANSGLALTSFPQPIGTGSNDFSQSMLIQTDNKIVLGGFIENSGKACFSLLRHNSDGSIDNNFFSSQGTLSHPGFAFHEGSTHSYGVSVGRQSDGKLILAGIDTLETFISYRNFRLVRFTQVGELDLTFGINGVVTIPYGYPSFTQYGPILILPDNKIIFAGSAAEFTGGQLYFLLAKFTADGALDNSFGVGGISSIQISQTNTISNLLIQADGKIIAIGTAHGVGLLARYNSNGTLDSTFGTGGIYLDPIVYKWEDAKFQSNNKLVVTGNATLTGGPLVIKRFILDSIQVPITTFSTALNIENGWNLVSFPGIHPNSMEVDTLFRFRNPAAKVFHFDGSGYVAEDTLKNGKGYWLNHTGQNLYNWNGTIQNGVLYPQLIQVNVIPFSNTLGWNMMGAYDYSFPTNELTTNPSGIINGLPFSYSPSSGYQLATLIEPSKGYFINLSGDGEIIFPPRSTAPLKYHTEEIIKDNWAKISIKDAVGKQYTLYSAQGDMQLDNFLLPPKPPAGLFDVRFNSDRMVEDLSFEKIIEITGAEYPLTISVTGMSMSLRDIITGQLVNTRIEDGGFILIENSSLNKFMVESDETTPVAYELSQNYPNPFNPSTIIKFSLAHDGIVTLKVFDVLGNEVTTVMNEQKQRGNYELNFDASSLASGVYFYKIISADFISTKKMILLK